MINISITRKRSW